MNTSRICSLALAALAILSCADEPLDPTGNEERETTIALSLTAAPEIPGMSGTRALPAEGTVEEGITAGYIVKDFWLLQFDERGYRVGPPRYYTMPTTGSTTAVAVIKPTSGRYKCVLLANTHSNALGTALGPINSLDDLKTIHKRIWRLEDMYNAGGLAPDLFMNGTVDVTSDTKTLTCALYRNVAKLTLTLTNNSGSGVTIASVQLRNVPDRLFYADRLFDGAAPPSPSPAQSGAIDLPVEPCAVAANSSKTLRYYLPRNCQGTTGTSTEAQKNMYAPGRATYIEIMAVTNSGCKPLRYRFYPGANMTNDFNIVPNFHYTLPIVFSSAGAEGDSRVENLGKVQLVESNSYLINPLSGNVQTTYGVPVTRINKFWGSPDGAAANMLAPDTGWEAEVIWQDKAGAGLIDFCEATGTILTTGKYEGTGETYFYFSPKENASGNVLIGVKKKGATEYLWSWHLWITGYNPDAAPSAWQENVYSYTVSGGAVHRYANGTGTTWSTLYTDKFIMDRNLGAASANRGNANTHGLYYQFGRKDPFPASSVLLYGVAGNALPRYHDNTDCISRVRGATSIKMAVQYPCNFYYPGNDDWVQNNPYTANSWNNPGWHESPTGKSLFDPCPPGWRLPVISTWNTFVLPGTITPNAANYPDDFNINTDRAGWEFYIAGSSGTTAFYPAAGLRFANSGATINARGIGYYWSSAPLDSVLARYLWFHLDHGTGQQTEHRGQGFSVRCVQE
ncbi:MAG: DUF4906 domain-containing protein [Odoribacteraceae bacterium]|jgi:uncharacterized protein (TIGR02145 family)|nr:DUF4906 domain-containing protein [Odoribacteraceae bacterium]